MSSSSPTPVYLVLGTPGAGRRALVADLIANGLEPAETKLVLLAAGEAPVAADASLAKLANTRVERWTWTAPDLPAVPLASAGTVFLLTDPKVSVVDQLEAAKPWLAANGGEIGRVLCVVDCQLAEREPALRGWYEACIHFSDVVFLARREGVANKWLSDFIAHFTSQFYPCHFIPVKKSGVENPALVLDPQPRRVSQYFEQTDELAGLDIAIEDEDEEDVDDEEADEDADKIDPYLERMRSGRRVKEVPDLRKYLPAK